MASPHRCSPSSRRCGCRHWPLTGHGPLAVPGGRSSLAVQMPCPVLPVARRACIFKLYLRTYCHGWFLSSAITHASRARLRADERPSCPPRSSVTSSLTGRLGAALAPARGTQWHAGPGWCVGGRGLAATQWRAAISPPTGGRASSDSPSQAARNGTLARTRNLIFPGATRRPGDPGPAHWHWHRHVYRPSRRGAPEAAASESGPVGLTAAGCWWCRAEPPGQDGANNNGHSQMALICIE